MTTAANAVAESARPASPKKGRTGGVVLEWNGPELGTWERWYLAEDAPPVSLPEETPPPKNSRRILALPTSSLFAWPLWIASEGESLDLIRLELAGRHLLKRGMEDSLRMRPVASSGERRLVVALACEEPFPEEGLPENWKQADLFEIRPNLLNAPEADLVIWKENGRFYASFQREGRCVWFCPVREDLSGDLLFRTSLRLLSEGVLHHPIRTIRILADVAPESSLLLGSSFPHARITNGATAATAPLSQSGAVDLPPAAATAERRRRRQWELIRQGASVAALLYALLLLWMAGDHLIHRHALDAWKKKVAAVESPARLAQEQSQRWKALRPAVDPTTYPLDLLAAVAAPTEGGKVRLTAFTLEKGRLQVSGEATDVTQAYAFIEQLKKSPALHEYDWNAGQPQIAGKNSVKFDMEGVRPDAAK
jgi:hypothetical protein